MQRYGFPPSGDDSDFEERSDGKYILHSEAQAEIERLQKEVERYEEQNRALLDDQIPCACGYDEPDDVCVKHHPAFKRELATAHNDAIEAAAAYCDTQTYTPDDVREPEYYIALGHERAAAAIRALKR